MRILSHIGYDWKTFEKVGQVEIPFHCDENLVEAAKIVFLHNKTEENEIRLVAIWTQARQDCQKAIQMPSCLNRQRAKVIALHYLTQGSDFGDYAEVNKLLSKSLNPTLIEVGKIMEAGASINNRYYSYKSMVAWTKLWTAKYLPFRW